MGTGDLRRREHGPADPLTTGNNQNVVVRPIVAQFIAEHLAEPHPVAAQAMIAEFGEPADVSLVRSDGSITVRFGYRSSALGGKVVLLSHSWRFGSVDEAVTFRELVQGPIYACVPNRELLRMI